MTAATGAKAVVECLKREGVKCVFSLPGTTTLDIYDVLYDTPEIELIVTRHEQVAAFMADGYARASGQPGVCLVSRGPGAANIAIGMHNAFEESSPVVALVGHVSSALTYRACFEEMDLATFFRPVTKWAAEIPSAQRIPELLQRAMRTAAAFRPRPVMVSLPLDVQREKLDEIALQPFFRVPPHRCGPEEIQRAARVLLEARRPALFLGGGAAKDGATGAVMQVAETLGAPLVTTWRRNDVFPNEHNLYLGSTGPGDFASTLDYLAMADAVLAVGCRFSEFSTHRYKIFSPQCKLVHIDIDPEEIGKIFVPEVGIVSDARPAAEMLLAALQAGGARRPVSPEAAECLERYRRDCQLPPGQDGDGTVYTGNLVKALQDLAPRNTLFVMDATTFEPWMTRYFKYAGPGSLMAPAGGSLGFGFPAALGAKLARPEKPVVCVVGDGAYAMVNQDLETAVRYNIPVVVIVTNNFSYGNIRDRQDADYNGRRYGCNYTNPDFAAQARLMGALGERVTSTAELETALRKALSASKPFVLDVILGPDAGLPAGVTPPLAK